MHPRTVIHKKPRCFSFEITQKCALNCVYCTKQEDIQPDMTVDRFQYLMDKLDDMEGVDRILFCGLGETFLHKELKTIIQSIKDKKISMITSGTVKIDFEAILSEGKVDIFLVSVDAVDEKEIKKICGEQYNYDNLIYNLEQLSRYSILSKKGTDNKVITIMNCTINENNMYAIEDIVDFASKYQFVSVHFSLPWGQDDLIRTNAKFLAESFKKARKKAVRGGIYMEDPFRSYCCLSEGSVTAHLDIMGNVYPCGYALNQNYKVGNLMEDSFASLWENKKYDYFKEGNLCRECFMANFFSLKDKEKVVG